MHWNGQWVFALIELIANLSAKIRVHGFHTTFISSEAIILYTHVAYGMPIGAVSPLRAYCCGFSFKISVILQVAHLGN